MKYRVHNPSNLDHGKWKIVQLCKIRTKRACGGYSFDTTCRVSDTLPGAIILLSSNGCSRNNHRSEWSYGDDDGNKHTC